MGENKIIVYLIIGFVMFNNIFVWADETGKKITKIIQPYTLFEEGTFMVGFFEKPNDFEWGNPVPIINEENIYDYVIKDSLSDSWGTFAKIDHTISLEKFMNEELFFVGYIKSYRLFELSDQNPDVKWLKNISLPTISVFEIKEMIPTKNIDKVLSIDMPETFLNKFEITVSLQNPLQSPLMDSILHLNISGGPFKIIEGDSYYTKTIKDKYATKESKAYKFTIEKRNPNSPFYEDKDFMVSIGFAGYGVENTTDNKKIQPVYSKKSYKYQFQWSEGQQLWVME